MNAIDTSFFKDILKIPQRYMICPHCIYKLIFLLLECVFTNADECTQCGGYLDSYADCAGMCCSLISSNPVWWI